MNEQIKELYLSGTSLEEMWIAIYDMRIKGVTNPDDAEKLASESQKQMTELGYTVETRKIGNSDYHFFV